MDDATHLHPTERDVAVLAGQLGYDAYFQQLIGSANLGGPTPVGILANGMYIYGWLTSERYFAEKMDEHIERIVTRGEESTGPPGSAWTDARRKLRDIFVKKADENVEDSRRLSERIEAVTGGDSTWSDLLKLPKDLAREAISDYARPVATLTDVTLVAPGSPQVGKVPVMRLHVSQIVGWWILSDRDDEGRVVFTHPPGSQQAGHPEA